MWYFYGAPPAPNPMCLPNFKVKDCPPSLYYIPNFITEQEENELLRSIYSAPQPKWVNLSGRRLQNWGGVPSPKGMLTEKIPEWLRLYMDRVSNFGLYGELKANHVLINEYKPGQGISPHHDGPLYYPAVATINLGSYGVLDFYEPLNDGEYKDGKAKSFAERYIGSALLQPRSLNVLVDEMYTHCMHGIDSYRHDFIGFSAPPPNGDTDDVHLAKVLNLSHHLDLDESTSHLLTRGTRVSITIRHVPRASKLKASTILNKCFHY